jgi:transcriptional antiterminator RfaH
MLLTVADLLAETPDASWFCLRCQPKREHVASAHLRKLPGVETCCPRVRIRKATRRGPVWFVTAMFPGYLFARFNFALWHRLIKQTTGITGFVQFGDRLALLPDNLVSEIRDRSGADEILEVSHLPEPGQQVRVASGPFEGAEALVTRLLATRDRVEILMEWLGRSLPTEVATTDLELLSSRD